MFCSQLAGHILTRNRDNRQKDNNRFQFRHNFPQKVYYQSGYCLFRHTHTDSRKNLALTKIVLRNDLIQNSITFYLPEDIASQIIHQKHRFRHRIMVPAFRGKNVQEYSQPQDPNR